MKIITITALLVSALFLASCSVVKVLQATGGSRADGIVELSYQYGSFEKPVVDWGQGTRTATERCQAWDFERAEPFGGSTSQCQSFDGYGNCVSQLVTVKYQCIGFQ